MSELQIGSAGNEGHSGGGSEKNVRQHRPWLGVLCSLLCPGLGQIYNSQTAKGFTIAFASWAMIWLTFTRIMASFLGLILAVFTSLLVQVFAAMDSYFRARRLRDDSRFPRKSIAYRLLMAIVILGTELAVTSDYALKRFYPLHAFKVPSGSMCPTVCEGDRVMANLSSFRGISPRRGDVVLFLYQDETDLHIKRVAAVGGDTVSAPNGRVRVNGIPVETVRSACGTSTNQKEDYGTPQEFVPGVVPPSHLFLLGDNEGNSYDSRYYGTVDVSRIRGKLLYLYWSPQHGRIGCSVK